jgi:tetratricopeptide (TPR) repeat protein
MRSVTTRIGLYVLVCLLMFFLSDTIGQTVSEDSVSGQSEYSIRCGPADSAAVTEALALFGARYRAVAAAAKVLTRRMLLEPYHRKQREIFCLAADGIEMQVLEWQRDENRRLCRVAIAYRVSISDFVRADLADAELEKKESNFSWEQEMEQPVGKKLSPGHELSRAYRYLRKNHRRVAIIYLDHLLSKYPNWGDAYFARAIGLHAIDEPDKAVDDLKQACGLHHQEACARLGDWNRDRTLDLELD